MKDVHEEVYGPTLAISEEIHAMKYRSKGETFREAMTRVAEALKDDEDTSITSVTSYTTNAFYLQDVSSLLWVRQDV